MMGAYTYGQRSNGSDSLGLFSDSVRPALEISMCRRFGTGCFVLIFCATVAFLLVPTLVAGGFDGRIF